MTLSSQRAVGLVNVALSIAEGRGVPVSVAVVDAAGFLLAFGRADGARAYTAEVAQGKAYSVVFMGRPSEGVRDLAESRPQFFDAIKNLGMRTMIPSPGGIPVLEGAIGVSGAPDPAIDVAIAQEAIAQLGLSRAET